MDGFSTINVGHGEKHGNISLAFVYFLKDGEEIIYVGYTRHIGERINYHRWMGKKFDSFGFKLMGKTEAMEEERLLIEKYEPSQNVLHVSDKTLKRRERHKGLMISRGTMS